MFSPNMLGLNHRKIKKTKAFLHGFIELVNKSKHKQNKVWVDHGREFCNKLVRQMVRQ